MSAFFLMGFGVPARAIGLGVRVQGFGFSSGCRMYGWGHMALIRDLVIPKP